MIKAPKKLIEVALPLEDINIASAREKSIRHGHPSTLHLWWARRPLAAARAVLFAQLVNDPGGERGWGKYPGQTKEDAQKERERLFGIIRELVKWENTNNETLLEQAREEIRKSWRETCELNKGKPCFDPDKLPAFHDPFAGGGSIPLEAQRLGLEAHASDLNPVAVLINKAMIEIPPKFAGRAPVGPIPKGEQIDVRGKNDWPGASGLAEDVRRYGHWMREQAEKRIGHLYPKVKITKEMIDNGRPDLRPYLNKELTVIAWLWARTIPSPNPAANNVAVPLTTTFKILGEGNDTYFIEPIIDDNSYFFVVKRGIPPKSINAGTKLGRGVKFRCLITESPIPESYIKEKACAGHMAHKIMAVIAEADGGRVCLSSTNEMEDIAQINVEGYPKGKLSTHPQYMAPPRYGMYYTSDLFTKRQLFALTNLCSILSDLEKKVSDDYVLMCKGSKQSATREGRDYAASIKTFLSFAINRSTNYWSTLNAWSGSFIVQVFSRQVLPMVWDYAEVNPFSRSTGNWVGAVQWISKVISFSLHSRGSGYAYQKDASEELDINNTYPIYSTDPPYYDNVPYADISDYFYVWMRHSLKENYPELFNTLLVPKINELVADSQRNKTKKDAEIFFINGMRKAIKNIYNNCNNAYPISIYYAFKQGDNQDSGTGNIGWESFLQSVLDSGFVITGTWPIRTERPTGMKVNWNALASSIVLVCRKRDASAPSIPRRQFLRELKEELPEALDTMIGGKKGATVIAPVDLAQAAIGPGMAVYSRYSGILEADGSKMSVRDALIQINKVVDEFFNEAEGDMDSDTRFCIDWFMQYGFKTGLYGEADVLARAKGTSVDGLVLAGGVDSRAGKVRLLKLSEYPEGWDPRKDQRTPTWEALHHMIRVLRQGGESEAGKLLARMAARSDGIRQLAYRLYTLCERKGWAEEARAYNELIASWHDTTMTAHQATGRREVQRSLLDGMPGTK